MRRLGLLALAACATQRRAIRSATKIGDPIGFAGTGLNWQSVDVASDQGKVRVVGALPDKWGEIQSASLQVERLPITLVIDRKGVIRYVH